MIVYFNAVLFIFLFLNLELENSSGGQLIISSERSLIAVLKMLQFKEIPAC